MGQRLVVIGEITRAHGLHGEMRVTPLTDHPERFAEVTDCVLWDQARDTREPSRITGARRQGAAVLLSLAGCSTVEEASALVGRLVALPESEARPLPPGQFYPWQLEGCRVLSDDGREIGRVTRIEQSAAQDLWVVSDGTREYLIPAVAEIVREVDVAAGRVVIRPPDGLLEL
ncbi:MAG TPA: ribosome maturation factor RimM [Methylomirabilota bacterium]